MKSEIAHPSTWIDAATTAAILEHAHEAERMRQLHPQQLRTLIDNKWFKMFLPRQHGGLELSLPDALKIEEAISWADGSTGWVLTLCAGAGWFSGFIDPYVLAEFAQAETFCMAGSGALGGYADRTSAGYRIHGSWAHASGSPHATAFTVNCMLRENGTQLYSADGSLQTAAFILRRDEVVVRDTWNTMGMIATASHAFEVPNVAVPSDRLFIIDDAHLTIDTPIYRYPFLQFAEVTLAINISGMAVRFIDLAERILTDVAVRNNHEVKHIAEARQMLNDSRRSFYTNVDLSWHAQVSGKTLSEDMLKAVSERSRALVQSARQVVGTLYPHCGLKAAFVDSEINRVWRNINTAMQHALFVRSMS